MSTDGLMEFTYQQELAYLLFSFTDLPFGELLCVH